MQICFSGTRFIVAAIHPIGEDGVVRYREDAVERVLGNYEALLAYRA